MLDAFAATAVTLSLHVQSPLRDAPVAKPLTPLVFAGLNAREEPVSPAVDRAARLLSTKDRAVHAARFSVPVSGLEALTRDPGRLRDLLHDALFAANPDTRDPLIWDPSYKRFNPATERLSVRPFNPNGIDARLAEAVLARRIGAPTLEQVFRELFQSPTARLYQVHWDNQDDTHFDGIISLDSTSGQLAVLMSNDFA
jgi:hypothetical protein